MNICDRERRDFANCGVGVVQAAILLRSEAAAQAV
jgi:hypothetical protein